MTLTKCGQYPKYWLVIDPFLKGDGDLRKALNASGGWQEVPNTQIPLPSRAQSLLSNISQLVTGINRSMTVPNSFNRIKLLVSKKLSCGEYCKRGCLFFWSWYSLFGGSKGTPRGKQPILGTPKKDAPKSLLA